MPDTIGRLKAAAGSRGVSAGAHQREGPGSTGLLEWPGTELLRSRREWGCGREGASTADTRIFSPQASPLRSVRTYTERHQMTS